MLLRSAVLALWLAFANLVVAVPACADLAAKVSAAVDPVIEAGLKSSGAPGAAFVFVQGEHIVYQKGYGLADLATGAKVQPERTVWPIASVTKVATVMSVLQQVDAGRVDLDTDVNRYLERLQVPAQGYPPLTLRHLLSHTGGLDELPGRQFDGRRPTELASFVRDHLWRYRAPGVLAAYSTYGILLAALVLEDVTGERYDAYLDEHLFGPAGMQSARVMIQRGDERGVATPYALDNRGAEPMPYEWYISTPASSVVATAADMGRLLIVHLAGGNAGERRILSEHLTTAMQTQQATVHPAVPGWGLGLQMDIVNGRVLAEHGGDIGGFSSLFVLIPEEDAGFYIVNHGEGSNLRYQVKRALLDALCPTKESPQVPMPRSADAKRLSEYAGDYLSSIACRSCPRDPESIFTVEAMPDGTLALWGQRWIPVERDLFIRDDGQTRLGFARGPDGRISAVSGGSWRVADRIH